MTAVTAAALERRGDVITLNCACGRTVLRAVRPFSPVICLRNHAEACAIAGAVDQAMGYAMLEPAMVGGALWEGDL